MFAMSENRAHRRYSFAGVQNIPFSIVHYPSNTEKTLRFQMQDLSQGGVCLRGESTVKEGEVVRCELGVPGLPVTIPTLLRARWDRQLSDGYIVGMQFVV